MSRMKMVSPDATDPVLQSVFGRLKQRWGEVLHLYRVLGWSPALVKAWGAFAWSMRFDLRASRRLRELLVVQIAHLLGAHYEYEHHMHMALEEGVTTEQLAALPDWCAAGKLFDADEQLILQLGFELALSPGASAETMSALQARFTESDVIEILVTGAYYCGVARVINSLDLELEPGHAQLRPRNMK